MCGNTWASHTDGAKENPNNYDSYTNREEGFGAYFGNVRVRSNEEFAQPATKVGHFDHYSICLAA